MSDDGLLLVWESDERFGLSRLATGDLADAHRGKKSNHTLPEVLCLSIYSRRAGHEDLKRCLVSLQRSGLPPE